MWALSKIRLDIALLLAILSVASFTSNLSLLAGSTVSEQSVSDEQQPIPCDDPDGPPEHLRKQSALALSLARSSRRRKTMSAAAVAVAEAEATTTGQLDADHTHAHTHIHSPSLPVIDMISIGSNTRAHYQTVQERSFGTHASVRHFIKITEHNDTDQACHNLTVGQAEHIYDICRRGSTYGKLTLMKRHFAPRKWLFGGVKQRNPVGWLCAQKRPLDALHMHQQLLLQKQVRTSTGSHDSSSSSSALPDYLFVMDDDSWFHLDKIIPELQSSHPSDKADMVAGCLIRSPKDERFAFYWGGFGLILTKAVLQRLFLPLHCNNNTDTSSPLLVSNSNTTTTTTDFPNDNAFAAYACQRLELNLIGEQHFFTDGMSLMDVIYAYGAQQPYSAADQWDPTATFCMHSDTTLAYFLQYYHVGRHARDANYASVDTDRLQAYRASIKIKISKETVVPPEYESRGECLHLSDSVCTKDAHLCHYVTDKHMETLFAELVLDAPVGRYRTTTGAAVITRPVRQATTTAASIIDQPKRPRTMTKKGSTALAQKPPQLATPNLATWKTLSQLAHKKAVTEKRTTKKGSLERRGRSLVAIR
jgi:hypothetical protein